MPWCMLWKATPPLTNTPTEVNGGGTSEFGGMSGSTPLHRPKTRRDASNNAVGAGILYRIQPIYHSDDSQKGAVITALNIF